MIIAFRLSMPSLLFGNSFFFFYFYFYWSIAALHVVLASVEKQSELESEEELKSLLMKVKEKREKVGLKPNIQNTKIMAFGSITSWQIYGETMETVRDFIFFGSKITADGDCSHEIKRCLLLGRKL